MLLRGDEICLCAVDVAFGLKDHAAHFNIIGVLGTETNGFVEIGQCAIEVAPETVCNAAIEIGDGALGVDAESLAEVGDRSVNVALGLVGVAAIVERGTFFQIELDGRNVIGDRAVIVPLVVVGNATIGQRRIQVARSIAARLDEIGAGPNCHVRRKSVAAVDASGPVPSLLRDCGGRDEQQSEHERAAFDGAQDHGAPAGVAGGPAIAVAALARDLKTFERTQPPPSAASVKIAARRARRTESDPNQRN
jgi:hypothetical protein